VDQQRTRAVGGLGTPDFMPRNSEGAKNRRPCAVTSIRSAPRCTTLTGRLPSMPSSCSHADAEGTCKFKPVRILFPIRATDRRRDPTALDPKPESGRIVSGILQIVDGPAATERQVVTTPASRSRPRPAARTAERPRDSLADRHCGVVDRDIHGGDSQEMWPSSSATCRRAESESCSPTLEPARKLAIEMMTRKANRSRFRFAVGSGSAGAGRTDSRLPIRPSATERTAQNHHGALVARLQFARNEVQQLPAHASANAGSLMWRSSSINSSARFMPLRIAWNKGRVGFGATRRLVLGIIAETPLSGSITVVGPVAALALRASSAPSFAISPASFASRSLTDCGE